MGPLQPFSPVSSRDGGWAIRAVKALEAASDHPQRPPESPGLLWATWRRFDPSSSPSASLPGPRALLGDLPAIELPIRTPDCAVRSDHSFKASPYSDKGKFHSDLNAARNVNISEYRIELQIAYGRLLIIGSQVRALVRPPSFSRVYPFF